jgi:hypothetical protein
MLFPIITFDSLGPANCADENGAPGTDAVKNTKTPKRVPRERDIERRRQAGWEDDFASENVRSWRKETCWR